MWQRRAERGTKVLAPIDARSGRCGPVAAFLSKTSVVGWTLLAGGSSVNGQDGFFSHWSRIQGPTGLHVIGIHDLRDNHAPRALAPTMIGELLGHKKVNTTAR